MVLKRDESEFEICYTCNIGFRNPAESKAHQLEFGCDAERRIEAAAKGRDNPTGGRTQSQPLEKRLSRAGRRMLVGAYIEIRGAYGDNQKAADPEIADLFEAWGIETRGDRHRVKMWAKRKQGL